MIEHLYSALHARLGVVIQTDNPERLRQKLYAIRRETMDQDLSILSFIISPTDPTQLWIVKNDKTKGTPPAGSGDG